MSSKQNDEFKDSDSEIERDRRRSHRPLRFVMLTGAVLILALPTEMLAEDALGTISVDWRTLVARMPGETELAVSPDGKRILVGINAPWWDFLPKPPDEETMWYYSPKTGGFKASLLYDTDPPVDPPPDEPTLGNHHDPTVTRSGLGRFYYASMQSHRNIVVGGSIDGEKVGMTSNTAGDCRTFFDVADCKTDQPHIAADPRRSLTDDQLYLVWWGKKPDAWNWTAVIECSKDSGRTWSPPKAVWGVDKGSFPRVTVDRNGHVWVVMVENNIYKGSIHVQEFSSCVDGLEPTFVSFGHSSPIKVSDFDNDLCKEGILGFNGNWISGLDRCNQGNILASPTVAVDENHPDRVFVTWAQRTSGINAEIITAASNDGGRDGFPLRIRVDSDKEGASRFLPYSSAAGSQVFVGWYDRRSARAGIATNDTTDYFVGAVGIRDLNLVRVPDVRVTPYSDFQCQTWPRAPRQKQPAEECTHQPQLAGTTDEGLQCDYSDTANCATSLGAPKYGDYNGIASAGGKAFLTWASHVSPLPRGGQPPPVGDLSVYFARATPDTQRGAEMVRGDAFIYQLSNDGKIEKPIQQSKLARGIRVASPFSVPLGGDFLFLLNTNNPGFKVRRLELGGSLGQDVDSKSLGPGWTSVATYGILGSTFVFMYRSGDGFVRVRRIEISGVVTPSADSLTQNLESGWTSVSHYAVGGNNFLLFVNANTGAMQVRPVNSDGTADDPIQTDTWTRGYTTLRPFSNAGGNFLFKLKAGNGTMHVEKIQNDGKTGGIIDNQNFDNGFKIGIPYNVAGGTFVLLLNPDTGALRIRRISDGGIVGAVTEEQEFTTGWKTAAIYTVVTGKYLALIKP